LQARGDYGCGHRIPLQLQSRRLLSSIANAIAFPKRTKTTAG
jgi:hypothetical protein